MTVKQRKKPTAAVQASRRHGLSPHRHTGHVLPRRNTSYPVLFMIVLCVGVLLAGYTRVVTADTITKSDAIVVRTSVPGPAPTTPATIDSPTDGQQFTQSPITVSGSCPMDTYVRLQRNGAFSGVSMCSASGTYSIVTDLFPGSNVLIAKVYNTTDVPGPDSTAVTVTYHPPAPPSGGGSSGGSSGGTGSTGTSAGSPSGVFIGEPLIIKTNFVYQGYYVGDTTEWHLTVEGGTAPYALEVDWGDGQHSLVSRSTPGIFTLLHTYAQAGGYHGGYVVVFHATDSDGSQSYLQTMSIINNRPVPGASTGKGSTGSSIGSSVGNFAHALRYIWPSYAIVVLMLISFWLGERREFNYLKPRFKRAHHA